MPFMSNSTPCKVYGEKDKETRVKFSYQNNKYYIQSTCKDCSSLAFKEYQLSHLPLFSKYNKETYLRKVGSLTRDLNRTPEDRAQRARDKSNLRCTRAKQARFIDELTLFVYKEAHELRKLRTNFFGFEWHVDHIIPLKGVNVCGLHIYNNFAVIPKVDNLRKGNCYPLHD